MPNEVESELGLFLTIFSTSPGTAILSGFSYFSPFPDLSLTDRQNLLNGLKTSSIFLFRKAFRGFKTLAILKFLSTTKELQNYADENPSWKGKLFSYQLF